MAEPDRLTAGLVTALGEHELRWIRPYHGACSCGSWDSRYDAAEEYRAHLADQMVEVVDAYTARSEHRLRLRLARKLSVLARQAPANSAEQRAYAAAGRVVLKG
jgi:hypothetical protein